MLDSVIRWSLHYRFLVVVASLFCLVYGAVLTSSIPIDVFPDLDRPRVIIITECPAMATEEVETLVTQPIEVALLGANGVQAVRSQTTAGLNVIYIEFDWDTDTRIARQVVQERLATLDAILPDGVVPQMTPPSSIMGQIQIAGIYRQKGPQGGILAPVDNIHWMAELFVNNDGVVDMNLWDPVDRHDLSSWTMIPFTSKDPKEFRIQCSEADVDKNGRVHLKDNLPFTIQIGVNWYSGKFLGELPSKMELRTLANWVIRPRVLKVKGVAEVFMQGADEKQYQILVNPERLVDYGVSLQEVRRVLKESNINTSGGFSIKGESEKPIRILGRLGPDTETVLQDLRNLPVKVTSKRTVLMHQIATITEGAKLKRGDGSINGMPGVAFTVVKQPHYDTRKLTNDVTAELESAERSLPADIIINTKLFRLKNFIDRGIFNVAEALVVGAVLVIIVLFLFLLNFRTTFITLTAIPLSLVATTLAFRLISFLSGSELSINVMTLGGIAVAMGELVDDAIVDVENIFRRLKENHTLSQPKPAIQVVYQASKEIRSSIVFGTLVVILVFLPLFFLSGVEGRLFAPLGVAYIVSILASLLISLTVTPVLSYYLLPNSKSTHTEGDGILLRFLKWIAGFLVRFSMSMPGTLLFITWLFVAVAAWKFSNLGTNFLPKFDEGSVQVNVTLPPGSSLEASNRVSALIDEKFRQRQKSEKNPDGEILYFVRRTGRAQMDEHASPVNFGEYILSMNPEVHSDREATIKSILEELESEVPAVGIEVEQPLAHLISHMVSGVYAEMAVKIYGDDLNTLRQMANRAKKIMGRIDGITTPMIEPIQETDELHIRLRSQDLAYYGLTRGAVANLLQTALNGEVVSEVLQGQRRFDLLVRLEERHRNDEVNFGQLRIDLPNGKGQVKLQQLADIGTGLGPNAINREDARRRIVIRCNTQGRDLGSAAAEIQSKLDSGLNLPPGYSKEFSGQFESQQKATKMIMVMSAVSFVGVFVVLMILLPSVRIVLQILNALPTAFIGGVIALVLTGQVLTVASLVGFISLGGIAVRNGILLVTHYIHLIKEKDGEFSKEIVLQGSLERLAPVLMTALTAGIALIPLVLGGDEPGREILYPVATVILGGLFTSTFCEFLIHPGLFWAFSGQDAAAVAKGESENEISSF